MSEVEQLLAALKRELRLRGVTYRDVAKALAISEPTVKRLFSTGRFTLHRLAQLTSVLGLTLAEVVQGLKPTEPQLSALTMAQEAELVSDPKLLLVAVCALNNWTVAEIVATYRLSEPECVQRLLRLDRMRLIDLLPGNRVRLNVARNFDWLSEGPIRRLFMEQGQGDFLDARFDGVGEMHAFAHGMLTRAAADELHVMLRRLRAQFDELHRESLAQPLAQRHGTGLLLAVREWELERFSDLRRSTARGK
ncbi:MAG TPA: helix-turn-helix domain-containing protein [Casimicrobiaceae bacterium]|nr:helix-turn-helix domain-containing protein [Casimicrobiaceae bacterium]